MPTPYYYIAETEDGAQVSGKITEKDPPRHNLIAALIALLIFSLIPFTIGYMNTKGESDESPAESLKAGIEQVADGLYNNSKEGSVDMTVLQILQSAAENKVKLQVGDKGDEITALQDALISLGYDCGGGKSDGVFGQNTEASVIKFQTDHGLKADGIAGKQTLNALIEAIR